MARAEVVRGQLPVQFWFQGRGLIFFLESLRIAPKGEEKVCQILVASIHKSFTESRDLLSGLQMGRDEKAHRISLDRPAIHRPREDPSSPGR